MEDIFKGSGKEKNELYEKIKGLRDSGLSWRDCEKRLEIPQSTLRLRFKEGVQGVCSEKEELTSKGVQQCAKNVYKPKALDEDNDTIKALILGVDYINKQLWKQDNSFKSPVGHKIHLLSRGIWERMDKLNEDSGEDGRE